MISFRSEIMLENTLNTVLKHLLKGLIFFSEMMNQKSFFFKMLFWKNRENENLFGDKLYIDIFHQ